MQQLAQTPPGRQLRGRLEDLPALPVGVRVAKIVQVALAAHRRFHQLVDRLLAAGKACVGQQLLDAVRRVGLLARDTTPVRMEFNALGVKLSSSSPDLGQAVETVEARYEGEDLTVAFNPQYLIDGLTASVGESIQLDVRDGLKPGVVHGEGGGFTYLVMPVRLPAAVP